MAESNTHKLRYQDPRRTPAPPHPFAKVFRWAAMLLLTPSVFFCASVGIVLFPYWDLDPTTQWIPITGLTPSQTLLLSAIPPIAAAAAMLADMLDARRVLWGQAMLGAIGAAGVLLHGLGPAGLEHTAAAAPWIGMIGAWIAAAQLATHPPMRRLLLALSTGFVVVLLGKGLLQVYVEHPQTIAGFQRSRDAVLASKGWAPGSPSALAYERRLLQAEATGWFGLSNVYATFAAAAAAGLLAACVVIRKNAITAPLAFAACAAGVLAAAGALFLSGSKGGLGSAVVALSLAGAAGLLECRRPALAGRLAPWIGPGAIAGVLALVAIRGLVGESIGERSLLFRAFYAEGALRIWAHHPLLGVGPAGFQDAYASAKPPLSPEDVMSPHSVLLDWTSTLGVFGLAWAALFVRTAAGLLTREDSTKTTDRADPIGPTRTDVRFIVLVAAVVTVLAVAVERPLMTPDAAAARLAGMIGWIAVALGVVRVLHTPGVTRWLAFAAGLVLIVHAQIEVTPVWINAAMLFGLWIGAAPTPTPGSRKHTPKPLAAMGLLALPAAAAVLIAMGERPLARWEHRLEDAADIMQPVAALAEPLGRAGPPEVSLEALAARTSALLGRRVRPTPDALDSALARIRFDRLEPAAEILEQALLARPAHRGTRSALSKLLLERAAGLSRTDPEHAHELLQRCIDRAETGAHIQPGSVGAWDWLAVTCEQAAAIDPGHADDWLDKAADAWKSRDHLSPYAIRSALHLMNLADRTGRHDDARRWSAEVLRRDALTRLDPLVGLSDTDRARAERLAGPG